MTVPTQGVSVRRAYYGSGTPPVLPVLYDDQYDAYGVDVLDPVLQYDGARGVVGYTWNGTRQIESSATLPNVNSATLLLNLQANAGVTETGGRVSTWSDQSGNGNHFTQGTAISRPTKVSIGGYPAVYFAGQNGDSVAEYMTASPFADNLSKFAVFIVSKFDTVAQWSAPIIEKMEYIVIGDILKGWKVQTTTDGAGDTTAKLNMQNPANDVLAVYKIVNNTNFLVSSLEYLGSTGHAYINGSNTGESIAGAVAAGTFANAADVILGGDIFDLPSSGWSGWLRAVLVYQITDEATWNATDRSAITAWVASQYGISL